MYVGLPLEYTEIIRLLGEKSEEFSVEDYLKKEWSPFTCKWIDKNLWVLGVKIHSKTYIQSSDIFRYIQQAEQMFHIEVKRLNIDLSCVYIAEMGGPPMQVMNAKPYFLNYD